jgi:hypothetical protein
MVEAQLSSELTYGQTSDLEGYKFNDSGVSFWRIKSHFWLKIECHLNSFTAKMALTETHFQTKLRHVIYHEKRFF